VTATDERVLQTGMAHAITGPFADWVFVEKGSQPLPTMMAGEPLPAVSCGEPLSGDARMNGSQGDGGEPSG
jgi:hypothetical protein